MSPAIILRTLGPRQPFKSTVPVHASPFVGADLTSAPHTSAYGALVRLVRLNGMRRSDMAPLLGIRTQRAQDLGAVMTFSEARHTQLATALRLSDVPASWNLSAWFPFVAPSSLMKEGWRFRYCPDCFRTGYHVHLHQLPWFDRCPWHGTALTTTCRACRKDIHTGADWLEDRDMICECGQPTAGALLEPTSREEIRWRRRPSGTVHTGLRIRVPCTYWTAGPCPLYPFRRSLVTAVPT